MWPQKYLHCESCDWGALHRNLWTVRAVISVPYVHSNILIESFGWGALPTNILNVGAMTGALYLETTELWELWLGFWVASWASTLMSDPTFNKASLIKYLHILTRIVRMKDC